MFPILFLLLFIWRRYLKQHSVRFEDSLLANKAGKIKGLQGEYIIEINLESHNLVQNGPKCTIRIYRSWTFNPKDHIDCKQSKHRNTIYLYIYIYLFIYFDNFFFTISGLPRPVKGCGPTHGIPLLQTCKLRTIIQVYFI